MSLFTFNSKRDLVRKIPGAFVVFLVMFFLTEYFIATYCPAHITNPTTIYLDAKLRLAANPAAKSDLIILGDSAAGGGIQIKELEKKTGMKCFNFALIGNAGMAGCYFVLKNYERVNGNPKYIVLMNVYDSWSRGIRGEGVMQILMFNFYENLLIDTRENILHGDLLYSPGTGIFLKVFFNRFLPSVLYKHEIRTMLKRGISKEIFAIGENKTLDNNLIRESSSKYEEIDRSGLLEELAAHKSLVKQNKFALSGINSYFLNKFLRETKKKGITVFIVYPPVLREFYEDEIHGEYLSAYKIFMESIKHSHDNVVFLTDDFYVVDESKLSSCMDHLLYNEAVAFTKMLAGKILHYENKLKSVEE